MANWFDAREAAEVGTRLADDYARGETQDLLGRADRETGALRLNFYKRVKFANSFKWRLIEKGVAREIADAVTHSLVIHLSQGRAAAKPQSSSSAHPDAPAPANVKTLLERGNDCYARGSYSEAISIYRSVLEIDGRNVVAWQNVGASLLAVGLLEEAEPALRQAIDLKPDYAEACCNLGIVLRSRGDKAQSELWLRRALKVNPKYRFAEFHLAVTLLALGRLRDARGRLQKLLKRAPRHAEAVYMMGHVSRLEGEFEEAEALFKRALEIDPRMAKACAALTGTRKMTAADGAWLKSAEEFIAGGLSPPEEMDLRFAIGKYSDDIEDFGRAFENYRRANDLLKISAERYEPESRKRFVDDMIRVYSAKAVAAMGGDGRSDSKTPTFIVGMPRSGTSLVEQIVASHPSAKGGGELGFCDDAMQENGSDLRSGLLTPDTRRRLAETYLQALTSRAGNAARIVDKAPVNSDYIGAIHSVFPAARIIRIRRDPIDTCLSCYFQHFSAAMSYTTDLSDLAHYYRQHRRLMAHWHSILPAASLLDVPYEELVADQEAWTRKILAFLDLEWDERCLNFQDTRRQVVTASYWQVRQKIYKGSVGRWRNYEKFIGPLLDLED